jgi:hypothetical protein
MILIASDIESLSRSLSRWEWGEYISEAFVIIACAGELVADLEASWLTEERKKHLQRRSTILLVAALSVSLICLVRTNELSGSVIGSLGDKAEEADQKAREAITDSSTALSQAKDALTKAGKAQDSFAKTEDEANKAQTASSSALTLAIGARREADSFEKDIASAKTQAAEAESHLAEALKEAAAAQLELNLLKTPRSLTNIGDLISALAPFKGTEFGFTGIYGDQESRDLAEEISDAVQLAGWKPTSSPTTGHASMYVWLKGFNGGAVGVSISTGVHIGATSEEDPETLNKLPTADRPRHINAAIALKNALALSISPKQEDLLSIPVNVQKFGKFTEVIIDVGNKPTTSNKTASH